MAAALPIPGDCCETCDNCAVTVITITEGGGDGGGGVGCAPVRSLNAVRSLNSTQAAACMSVIVNGEMIGGDGFNGTFTWDSVDAIHVDDGANYLEASDHPLIGRWKRL